MNEIHVCFSTDDNYAPYCGAAITSLIRNKAPEDDIRIYILYKNLSAQNIEALIRSGKNCGIEIEMIRLDSSVFLDMPIPDNHQFTVETYFGFVIPRLFPEAERMIYLDCDVFVRGSLSELFDRDIGGNALGMVVDVDSKTHIQSFNAGVWLINCGKWRQMNLEFRLLRFIAEHKDEIRFADQDAINGELEGLICPLESKWNHQIHLVRTAGDEVTKALEPETDVKVIHYAGFSKPWHGVVQNELVDEYFAYMQTLPWHIPDRRERNLGLNPAKYYWYFGILKTAFKQSENAQKIIFLHETYPCRELRYAATDLGRGGQSFLIHSSGWEHEDADIIIIEYHNIAIINHILLSRGYDLQTDGRIVLILETPQGIDSKLLAAEYLEFLRQEENR